MTHNLGTPRFILDFIRQLSVNQQVRYFQEIRFFCQIFYRITSIMKDSLVSVDISDCGFGNGSVLVGRIVYSQAFLLAGVVDLFEIRGVDCIVFNGNLI
jgi:hypothetical protein